MNKSILHLNLKRKWFDMIRSGEKKEEYREIKPYWDKLFFKTPPFVICFSNGYSADRDQFFIECIRIDQGYGKGRWGAEPGKRYHILSLGKIKNVRKE